jgi:hypothetical protein
VCRRARSLFLRLRLLFPTCASAHVARGRIKSEATESNRFSRERLGTGKAVMTYLLRVPHLFPQHAWDKGLT